MSYVALVPMKRVLDPYVKVQLQPNGEKIQTSQVKMVMNPFDEIALEEVIAWKKAGRVEKVIALTIGTLENEDILRQAFARGATEAWLIETEQTLLPIDIARILAFFVNKHKIDIVFMGKQAVDSDHNQTGQILAEALSWPQATFCSKCVWKDCTQYPLDVVREVDGGLNHMEISLPCVLTSDLRLNEPSFLSLPSIMKAKQKPINTMKLEECQVQTHTGIKQVELKIPQRDAKQVRCETPEELIEVLKEKEGLVL